MPFPTPGGLPDPRIELLSLAASALAVRFFTTEPPGKPLQMDQLPSFSPLSVDHYSSQKKTFYLNPQYCVWSVLPLPFVFPSDREMSVYSECTLRQ